MIKDKQNKERKSVIKGGKAGVAGSTSATKPRPSFGSSVSSAMGVGGFSKKRSLNRNVTLGNGYQKLDIFCCSPRTHNFWSLVSIFYKILPLEGYGFNE